MRNSCLNVKGIAVQGKRSRAMQGGAKESQLLWSDNRYFISVGIQNSFLWRNKTSTLSRSGAVCPLWKSTDLLPMERKHLSMEEQHTSLSRLHAQVECPEKRLENFKPARLLTAEAHCEWVGTWRRTQDKQHKSVMTCVSVGLCSIAAYGCWKQGDVLWTAF